MRMALAISDLVGPNEGGGFVFNLLRSGALQKPKKLCTGGRIVAWSGAMPELRMESLVTRNISINGLNYLGQKCIFCHREKKHWPPGMWRTSANWGMDM